jgi:uncharacterized LabA/DUF88 family protein
MLDIPISDFGLIAVLRDTFSDAKIVKLASFCGLVYPGTRLKSIPTMQLIEDIVEDYRTNPDSQKKIFKEIKKANAQFTAQIHASSMEEIDEMLQNPEEIFSNQRFGAMVFALATDERPEIQLKAVEFAEQVNDVIPDFEDLEEDWEEKEEDDYIEYLENLSDQLSKEKQQHIRKETRNKKEIESLKTRIEGRERQLAALRNELSEKKSAFTKTERENKELLKEMDSLKQKIKQAEAQTKESPLSSAIHHLERENKKLTHLVEKIVNSSAGAVTDNQGSRHMESLAHEFDRLRQSFNEIQHAQNEKVAALTKTMDEMSKKVDFIYSLERSEKGKVDKKAKKRDGPQRVGVFVDVQNLYYAARQFSARIDFQQLLSVAVGDRRLVRAIAYVVQVPDINQTAFVSMLEQKNYEVKRKDLKVRADGSTKGDWDMGIAVDIMQLIDKLDVVIIASGDGDFVSLVQLIKTRGPRVEVFSFPHNTARELIEVADSHFAISESMFLK